jgi:hypothetical protein
MRWQDEGPIDELLREGVLLEGAYLTVARVGEDRKEAQIGSRPVDDLVDARDWLDSLGASALGSADHARLRIRLWRPDRTPVRGIQTRAWPDATDAADAPMEDDEAEATIEIDDEPPSRSIAVRPSAPVTRSTATAARVAARFQSRPRAVLSERPIPAVPVPCPTCASTSTTVALLHSRIAELSALLGSAQTAVRDARRDAETAQQAARSRGRCAQQAEAEVARLRSENAELVDALRELRAENRALHQQAAEIVGLVDSFDR